MIVVLPEPFGPRRPMISPARTEKLTPATARVRAEVLDQTLDLDHSAACSRPIW